MRKLLASALLMSLASVAHAAGMATLSWGTPTLHTDGSPITGALTYDAYRGLQGQVKTLLTAGITGNSYVDNGLTPGTWCYDLVAKEAGNMTPSDHGSEGCKTIYPAAPNSTATMVTKASVYYPKPQINSYVMVVVGTIPPNTPVIAGQYVNGMCVVDRSKVKWSGASKPQVVVAQCG